jgi:hypothetical protein
LLLGCADPHDGLPRGVELASQRRNRGFGRQEAKHLAFLRVGQCRRLQL